MRKRQVAEKRENRVEEKKMERSERVIYVDT